MLSRTSSIARRTSSRIVAYCALRSTRGISCVATAVMVLPSPSCLDPLRQVLEPRVRVRIDADEAREVADVVLELHRGVSRPHRARRHRMAHDAARTHERVLADLDPGQDRAVRADPCAAPHLSALHAVEVGRALRVRIVGEHDVRPEEDVVVDRGELEEASGVNAYTRADPVTELERRMRSDGDVVADHVVLADRGALSRLETRADGRAGVDRRERTDDRAGTDDELELALLLPARSAADDRV